MRVVVSWSGPARSMRPTTGYYWDSLAENIARKQRRSREKQKKHAVNFLYSTV